MFAAERKTYQTFNLVDILAYYVPSNSIFEKWETIHYTLYKYEFILQSAK